MRTQTNQPKFKQPKQSKRGLQAAKHSPNNHYNTATHQVTKQQQSNQLTNTTL